jgi:hypothetical protein
VANTVNPGGIRTGLQRNLTQRQRESLDAAEAAGVFTYKCRGTAATLTAGSTRSRWSSKCCGWPRNGGRP